MTTADLLNDDERNILKDAYYSAVDANTIIQKLVDSGIPYTEHLNKSKEQLAYFENILDAFGIAK